MEKLIIEVNKDIDRYKESVAMGLTARQLIFSILSVAIGGLIVLLTYKFVGLTMSAYIAIPVVAPIALSGFYSYNGMSFMEMMKRKMHFAFCNHTLTYSSTEGEFVLERIHADMEKEAGNKKKSKKFLR